MKHRWAARLFVLALAALMADDLVAQETAPAPSPRSAQVELGQNTPNPFHLDTEIPFSVGGAPQCEERGRLYRVSLRIYNLLSQLVAVPVLRERSGGAEEGKPLENLLVSCDRFVAYWNGKVGDTADEAPHGIYLYQLEVDGRRYGARRMMLVGR